MKPAVVINPSRPLLHQLSHLLEGLQTSLQQGTEGHTSATCWWPLAQMLPVPQELERRMNNSDHLLQAHTLKHQLLQHLERTLAGKFWAFLLRSLKVLPALAVHLAPLAVVITPCASY